MEFCPQGRTLPPQALEDVNIPGCASHTGAKAPPVYHGGRGVSLYGCISCLVACSVSCPISYKYMFIPFIMVESALNSGDKWTSPIRMQ